MRADLTNLFVLSEAFEKTAVRASFASSPAKNIENWSVGECHQTIALKQTAGRKLHDLIGTTYAGFYLLSHRIQNAFLSEKITGWHACPIDFKNRKDDLISGYNAIGITGRCGALDNARSGKVTRMSPKIGSSKDILLGLYFMEESWDGSDLFRPDGTMLTIATLRAKDVIDEITATNIRFRRILEFERVML